MADTVQQSKYNTRSAVTAKQAAKPESKKGKEDGKSKDNKKNDVKKNDVKLHESSDDDLSEDDDDLSEDDDLTEDESEDDDLTEDYTTEDESETDEDYIASADEGIVNEKLEHAEYQKFLSDLFPSKYMSEKVAAVEHKKSSAKCPGAPKKKRCESSSDDEEFISKKSSKNPLKNFNISFIINDRQQ